MTAKPTRIRMAVLQPYRAAPTGPRTPKADSQLPFAKPGTGATGIKPISASPSAVPGFKAAVGRPESNIGKYLIKPTDKDTTGYEMLNTTPDSITRAEATFLKQYELPPALQPKYLRKPEVMETARRKEISKGWIKPRGHVG